MRSMALVLTLGRLVGWQLKLDYKPGVALRLLSKAQKSSGQIFKLCSCLGIGFAICSTEQFKSSCSTAIPRRHPLPFFECVLLHIHLTAGVGKSFHGRMGCAFTQGTKSTQVFRRLFVRCVRG